VTAIRSSIEQAWQHYGEGCAYLITAHEGRAWEALGLKDWAAFVRHTLDVEHLKIPKAERQAIVTVLSEGGLSVREIAAATGLGRSTVQRELSAPVPNGTPSSSAPRGRLDAAARQVGVPNGTRHSKESAAAPREATNPATVEEARTRLESNQQPDDESIDEQDVPEGHLYRGIYPSPYALQTFFPLHKDPRLHDGFHTLLQGTLPDGLLSGPLSELVDTPWNVIADLASWGDWELCNAVIDRYVARLHELDAEIDLHRPGWADRLIALMNDLPPRFTLRCKCEEGENRTAIQHELAYSHGGEGSA
jgi:hypothetical protein